MKITKKEIEITPEEIRALYDYVPTVFRVWVMMNMERITGVQFPNVIPTNKETK